MFTKKNKVDGDKMVAIARKMAKEGKDITAIRNALLRRFPTASPAQRRSRAAKGLMLARGDMWRG